MLVYKSLVKNCAKHVMVTFFSKAIICILVKNLFVKYWVKMMFVCKFDEFISMKRNSVNYELGVRDRAERWNNGGVDNTRALCRLASDWQWSAGRHPRPPHLSTRISNRYRYHHRGGSSLPGTVQASPAPWLRPSTCPPPRVHSSALAVPVPHHLSVNFRSDIIMTLFVWWGPEFNDPGWSKSTVRLVIQSSY